MDLLGTFMKIKDEHKKAFESAKLKSTLANAAYMKGTSLIEDANNNLFTLIAKLYPETSKYHIQFNNETNEIIFIGEK